MLVERLAAYAAYHRDRRNVATHMVGIPMIVFAVVVLLSRPGWTIAGMTLAPAAFACLAAALYYLWLDLRFGIAMAALLALACRAAQPIASGSTPVWLAVGLGAFVLGWVLQFAGHALEGRKPAFLDDLRGLLIGPLFVLAELVWAFGGRAEVHRAVDHARSQRA